MQDEHGHSISNKNKNTRLNSRDLLFVLDLLIIIRFETPCFAKAFCECTQLKTTNSSSFSLLIEEARTLKINRFMTMFNSC